MPNAPTDCLLFPDLFDKPVQVRFSDQKLSSDGGLLLLKAREKKIGLIEAMAEAIVDRRQPGKIVHSIHEQVQQRVFGLAAGYRDVNEAAALAQDPMFRLACGQHLNEDTRLSSQPTLSRFENTPRRGDVHRMALAATDRILRHLRKAHRKAKRIWIDIDPTCTPTYGEQQLTFFNGYYDTWCYLPLVITLSFDRDPRKYPVAVLVRPGNADGPDGVLPVLRRLVPRLTQRWKNARLWLRADSAFARSDLLDWLEDHRIDYDIAVASNSVLARDMHEALEVVRELAERHDQTVTFFLDTTYQARSWRQSRRVLCKVEVVVAENKPSRDNVRFVITTGTTTPQHGFARYYGHSDMENTLKEFKHDVGLGRFSCTSIYANQLRALLSLAAFTLLQGLAASFRKQGERVQADTVRNWLVKVAVRVTESTRRIVVELAEHYPWKARFLASARQLGAVPI